MDTNERILGNELGEFYYQVQGPQDAPAIFFSHGVGMDHRTFDDQVQALQDRYRVITWDMPYHGRSDSIRKGISFSKVTADLLVAIMDALEIDQAFQAGLSLGSFVVQQLSSLYPKRVIGEIHISGGPLYPKFPAILKVSIPLTAAFMKLYPSKPLARTFAKHKALTADTIDYLVETVENTGKGAITHLTNEMVRDMVAGLPAPTSKPALIVYGDHDLPFIINMSKDWHTRLPNSELAIIENAHHILNQDNPAAFNAVLLDFLERIGSN
jgi:3-oxoadipate enol-lactonase